MTTVNREAAKLLSLSMSDSDSSGDTLRISLPRQKVFAKRKRKRKRDADKPLSLNGYNLFELDSLPKIGKCLLYGFVLAVLIMEAWLIVKISRRLDRIETALADAEGKHIPDSLRNIEQRLTHMRANQSQIEQLVGHLYSQLELINKNLRLVNGSAEELRHEISNTINKQMPSHFEKFNESLSDVQLRVTRVAGVLASTSEQLNILSSKHKQLDGAIRSNDASIATVVDVISGKDNSSSLARGLNSTIEVSVRRAQASIESTIQQVKVELDDKMSSTLNDSIKQLKRELSTQRDEHSSSSIASNTEATEAHKNQIQVHRPETVALGDSSRVSDTPGTNGSLTAEATDVTSLSPTNALGEARNAGRRK
ncbi:uncharacterized protein LOC100908009 [Galendromus occidentalis]|uniref:Uncharacterized protein LOC100908009 n=1 Tax=Galendromus occidentalis TaxID=34638 RepID=A0AAJ6VUY2_9ACAR|nr:uncharacterized protein LOC100908009 [Galendromus occidentalis]